MYRAILFSLLVAASVPANLLAQGLLISSDPRHRLPRPTPRPAPGSPAFLYDIAALDVDVSIRNQIAEVQVGQTFKNRTGRTLQVKFVFPLPYDGAIDQMTFLVDGQELEGRLLEADEAREIYQSYVRRSQDPALVQWIGTGMFQTQVFPVPPGAERTVSLRYTQLCRRSGSVNDWRLPLAPTRFTSRPIGRVSIRGRIRGDQKLGNVYSPSHDVDIDRSSGSVVRFKYSDEAVVPRDDFRVLWDTGDEPVQMSVVTHRGDSAQDGYFMLMIQPEFPEPPKNLDRSGKNVILVLDKSGSMRGEKINQTRRSASYIVERLKSRDQFSLINYDSHVETFRSELSSADKSTRVDASDYIESMLAGGSTNIDEALARALAMAGQADGTVYVVFMTDGQPTVGEKNAMKIADNARRRLHEGTRLFSLGVGHDVNSRLLDKLATICLGQTTYVRPGDKLDAAMSGLWDRIGAPAMTDARLKLTVNGKEGRTSQLYPTKMYDLFSGDQLVIVGRYRKAGRLRVALSGDYLGKRRQFVFEDELPKVTGTGENVFVERLWATRRIGQIIDEIDLHGESQELVDELIVLSKRHGILTPYTAYLAEENTDLNNEGLAREMSQIRLHDLQMESGAQAFRQRAFKGGLKSANRPTRSAPESDMMMEMEMEMMGTADFAIVGDESVRSGVRSALARVRQIGAKTFYLRGGRYIDSEATGVQVDKPQVVKQLSEAYFDLIGKLDPESLAFLAEEVEILVVISGRAYLITPAPNG